MSQLAASSGVTRESESNPGKSSSPNEGLSDWVEGLLALPSIYKPIFIFSGTGFKQTTISLSLSPLTFDLFRESIRDQSESGSRLLSQGLGVGTRK